MNNLALNTSRFHRVLELNKKISNLVEKFDTLAAVVNKFTEYDLEIFTEELGFMFYSILPKKLRNCDNKLPNLNIGDKFIVTIQKKLGFLPQDKILVTSLSTTEEFILVNIDSSLLNSPKDKAIWI